MTNEEALAHFKNHEYMTDFSWQDEMSEIAIEALEKQIAKKPLNVTDSIEDLRFDWTCPSCKRQFVGSSYGVNHCVDCGQKISWEGEGE